LILTISCKPAIEKEQEEVIVYEANWESLKQHEVPEWFLDAKFGIYTHWGAYAVPSWENEWYPRLMYSQNDKKRASKFYDYHKETWGDVSEFGYKDFIPLFTAENFDAEEWADLFKKSGAQFAGPVAQHHDGLAMWDSELTEWDAVDMGPKRDIVGELAEAIRAQDMKFVTSFHHAFSWKYYEPSYELENTDTKDPEFAGVGKIYPPVHKQGDPPTQEFLDDWLNRLKEVIDNYEPDYLWFDFGWGDPAFEKHNQKFFEYYYNAALKWDKEVVVTYKKDHLPRGVAVLDLERGQLDTLASFPWITDTSVDLKSWSYITAPDYKSVNTLVDNLVDRVSKNGNLLLNIGPKPDGSIPEEQKEMLLGIGEWLKVNGEAIYNTRPWTSYGEGETKMVTGHMTERSNKGRSYTSSDIRFTTNGNDFYATLLDWPEGNKITIKSLHSGENLDKRKIKSIMLLGVEGELEWTRDENGLHVSLPDERPCEHAYSLKLSLK
ncbi:MAG: alpha-L-fucosidase, partial [Bacteroidales bacterium]|nr:alpha-L-fucosidase [Bacteroidales bacterium]